MSVKSDLFFEEYKNKKIAFIGLGVSNFDSICLFLNKQIDVTVLDRTSKNELGEKANVLENMGAKFFCGEDYLNCLCDFDVVVRSPGVYFNKFELQDAIKQGVIVTSEMELFFDLCPCKIIGVTGSDGKTTTTTIISEMLKCEGYNVHIGGNIGKALLSEIEKINSDDIAVVELSSFQLISMRKSPDISVITNISPNHLDIHKNMDEYIDAKKNVILHQNGFGSLVLNLDNKLCNSQEVFARGFVKKFSRKEKVKNGAFFDENTEKIYFSHSGTVIEVLDVADITIPGIHNIENYLAAISAVFELISVDSVKKVAREFKGVKHRIEFIRQKNGVKWYNDSIATSPTRTIAGLKCFDGNVILIAGGYDKNFNYGCLAPELLEKVKILILMGNTAGKIELAVKNNESYSEENIKIFNVSSMEEAVGTAYNSASTGDIVFFSPASASFDLYKNFEQRGDHFRSVVNNL